MASPPVPEGAVAWADGGLLDVGAADEVARRWPGAAVTDLGEAILTPGFVDAHCHLEWSLLDDLLPPGAFGAWLGRMLPLRARMTPADHAVAARHGALRALRAGTTTLADSGPTGAGVAAMTELGLSGLVHLEAFGTPRGDQAGRAAAAIAGRVVALDHGAGPRVRAGLSPHAPYTVGPDLWRALARRPDLGERPWATHIAESEDEERVVARGEGPLAEVFASAGFSPGRWDGPADATVVARLAAAGALREGLVAAHCVRMGPGDPETLAAAGVGAAHCPRSNAHLRTGPAPLTALRDAGVRLGLGTDSPASGGDYDVRTEARACGATHGGLPAGELLRLATRGGAEALGLDGETGALAPGLRADIVALRPARAGDPHEAALDPATLVEAVVAAGDVLVEGSVALLTDAEAIDARAAEARERLW